MTYVILLCFVISLTKAVGRYDVDDVPLAPMSSKLKTRTLNCYECFISKGKMCSYIDNTSMINISGTSNKGAGVCCEPGYY